MRGKQAAHAANQRHRAAMDHIDRLTEQLADAKLRARVAEERSRQLEGADVLVADLQVRNNVLLQEAVNELKAWTAWGRRNHERGREAFREIAEMTKNQVDMMPRVPFADLFQLVHTRFPKTLALITANDHMDPADPIAFKDSPYRAAERRMDGDRLKRFQQAMGERATTSNGKDLADLLSDALEAREAGFDTDEIRELLK